MSQQQQMEGHTDFGREIEPGYKTIFYVVCGIAILYLALVFLIAS